VESELQATLTTVPDGGSSLALRLDRFTSKENPISVDTRLYMPTLNDTIAINPKTKNKLYFQVAESWL
jgi:hypothetical protein